MEECEFLLIGEKSLWKVNRWDQRLFFFLGGGGLIDQEDVGKKISKKFEKLTGWDQRDQRNKRKKTIRNKGCKKDKETVERVMEGKGREEKRKWWERVSDREKERNR